MKIAHCVIKSYLAKMMTVRKYGQSPYQFVVVHGGPGAPGSASSLARMLTFRLAALDSRTSYAEFHPSVSYIDG